MVLFYFYNYLYLQYCIPGYRVGSLVNIYFSDLFDDENAKLCLQYSLRMIAASQRRKL